MLLATGPHRGKVLMWSFDAVLLTTRAVLWDPATPSSLATIATPTSGLTSNIFCAGVAVREDGQVIVAGGVDLVPGPGNQSPYETYLFDPVAIGTSNGPWTQIANMVAPRFYPTITSLTLPYRNSTFNLGGLPTLNPAPPSLAPPGTVTWERLHSGAWENISFSGTPVEFESYPLSFHLSTGKLFVAGDTHTAQAPGWNTAGASWFVDLPVTPAVSGGVLTAGPLANPAGPLTLDRYYGSAILIHQRVPTIENDRVLVFGGSEGGYTPSQPSGIPTVHSSVQELTPGGTSWQTKQDLFVERVFANAVLLPTREIFVEGGCFRDAHNRFGTDETYGPVAAPELYVPGGSASNPGSTRYGALPNVGLPIAGNPPPAVFPWTPRVYHQVALLLPDARVLVAGGESLDLAENLFAMDLAPARHSGEVYSPPYLFQGPRPVLHSVPDVAYFSSSASTPNTINIRVDGSACPAGSTIDRVVLIRPGAVTHHFDSEQRYLELDFTSSGPFPGVVELAVSMPTPELAPQGFYMLFVIRDDPNPLWRVPSVAAFIRLQ